jgi:ribosome-binding protein aMBF1 (putative translation factor)
MGTIMAHATLMMNDEVFVLVPQREYAELTAEPTGFPQMPPANADGTFPALLAMRVTMARSIIKDRLAAGMTQKALAELAGVRVETLNRIEKAKVTPDEATIKKIDRALKRAAKMRK